jgi:hypothetical protein
MPRPGMTSEELESLWHEWACMEQAKRFHDFGFILTCRAAMGLYIQDAELASLYHAPPNLRHTGSRHYYACADEIFDAPDAAAWSRAMRAHPPLQYTVREYFNDRSRDVAAQGQHGSAGRSGTFISVPDPDNEFTLYIMLVGIQAQVCEAGELDILFTPTTQTEITTLLLAWYQSYTRFHTAYPSTSESPFCLMILWHSIFVSLFSNIHDLEIAFGSQGAKAAADQAESVAKWASTPGAKRAVLHVIHIRHLLTHLSPSILPPVHLPRIAFQSAIVCWCYIRYKELSATTIASPDDKEWPEFSTAGLSVREMQRELQRIRNRWGSDELLSPFSEILQKLGQWGLSKKLRDILDIAIHEETNMRSA